jgi:hypothetical protein
MASNGARNGTNGAWISPGLQLAHGALRSGRLWRRLFGAVLQLSLAEWRQMENGMASNGAPGSQPAHGS